MPTTLFETLTKQHLLDAPEGGVTLADTVLFRAENISDYFFAGTGQEKWDMSRDFPNLAPPYQRFFIEFRSPPEIASEEFGRIPWNGPKRWGVLFAATDMHAARQQADVFSPAKIIEFENRINAQLNNFDPMLQSLLAQYGTWEQVFQHLDPAIAQPLADLREQRKLVDRLKNGDRTVLDDLFSPDVRWTLDAALFFESLTVAVWKLLVKPTGQLWTQTDGETTGSFQHALTPEAAQQFGLDMRQPDALLKSSEILNGLNSLLHPALLTISFLHCRNVEILEHAPGIGQGKRKRHAPRIKYYTLNIAPMQTVLRTEGSSESTGLRNAIHICRGHFKHFTEDRKLFGKYAGDFWWHDQVRGHQERGEVHKDYRVNPPASESPEPGPDPSPD